MEFLTPDHPEANGKKAKLGDVEHFVSFTTDTGETVTIRMGPKTWQAHTQHVLDMLAEMPASDDPNG